MAEPPRLENGYRDYDDNTTERLRFIRDAQSTGLSLTEIASILEMREEGESTCHHVVELLERHLVEIERQIEALHRTRDQVRHCTNPNRCQTIEEDVAKKSEARQSLIG